MMRFLQTRPSVRRVPGALFRRCRMPSPTRSPKPKFRSAELWGACSRCNARVRYSTLARERLTGLLVCTKSSGRAVRPCWDPWPEVFDFQVSPDRSIEPPPEPLPVRWNLDDIWGNGPSSAGGYSSTDTNTFANGLAAAPDDATRRAALNRAPPYYAQLGKTASFAGVQALAQPVSTVVANLNTFIPADYDGMFIPSSSVRTVAPPNANAELGNVQLYDPDRPAPFIPGQSTLGGGDVLG